MEACHCERSEAISELRLLRQLDGFLAMTHKIAENARWIKFSF